MDLFSDLEAPSKASSGRLEEPVARPSTLSEWPLLVGTTKRLRFRSAPFHLTEEHQQTR